MLKPCIVVLAVALTGCSVLDPVKSGVYGDYAIKGFGTYDALVKSITEKSPDLGHALVEHKCFAVPLSTTDADTCKAQRNQAIAAVAVVSDGYCLEHRKTIYGNDVAYNLTLGTLTSLFAGGAAIVNSERRKAILGALALFTNSERALISDSVYKNVVAYAVDNKILEMRASKWHEMSTKFGESLAAYPMPSALKDAIEYHQSCSFMNGLVKALNEGTNNANNQKIQRLRNNLALAQADYARAVAAHQPGIQERINAINKELATLESQ